MPSIPVQYCRQRWVESYNAPYSEPESNAATKLIDMYELYSYPPADFVLTLYFYPLSSPLQLSDHLAFSLDNPRTDEEINYVAKILTTWQKYGRNRAFPTTSREDIVTLERVLLETRDATSDSDSYAREFFTSYRKKGVLKTFAQMWVIARFWSPVKDLQEDHSQKQVLEGSLSSPMKFESTHGDALRRLVNYSHLLSLLSHSEGKQYYGRNFVLDPYPLHRSVFDDLAMTIIWAAMAARDFRLHPQKRGELDWIFWPFAVETLKENARLIESAFAHNLAEKLIYVGELLRIANDVFDEKVRLLMLTSIIELLLTHNPDTGRFNVEDSINRQFQLKAALLVYQNNRELDLEQLKRRLKTIYQQRSNVAHGNFGAVQDYIRKLKKTGGEEEHFEDLIIDLYSFVRAIIEEYLKDVRLVEFLKGS